MITHDTRPIECGICNVKFPSEDDIRNHNKRVHEIIRLLKLPVMIAIQDLLLIITYL